MQTSFLKLLQIGDENDCSWHTILFDLEEYWVKYTDKWLCSHLDLLWPDFSSKIRQKQNIQKQVHDHHANERYFEIDDHVLAKNFRQSSPWLQGVIVKRSAISFLVKLSDNLVIRCHPDHLRHRSTDFPLDSLSPNDTADKVLAWHSNCTKQPPKSVPDN